MKLNNGYEIPEIGFGTWLMDDNEAEAAALKAINNGYKHIDTAAYYKNEIGIGKAIKKSKVSREDIFVTSKVWNEDRGYEKTINAFNKTLENLGLDYLDLYLIHWPANTKQFGDDAESINIDTWRALEDLYTKGKIKAIGVCNFKVHHLKPLVEKCRIKPMVNQIEFHPGFMQKEILDYCKDNDIAIEGWSPLGRGRMLDNELLIELAGKYKKSVAQICLRWANENKVIPIPKSTHDKRMLENKDIFDFKILDEDVQKINNMMVTGESGQDPDEIEF